MCGLRASEDATLQNVNPKDYHSDLQCIENLQSKPFLGRRFAVVKETMGEGVDEGVVKCVLQAAREMEQLGATIDIVSCPSFDLGLPAYYVLALSEASSNLARYDNIRYGAVERRREGFGPEVKRRILMGSFALSAGYSDAYYKRAQEVQRIVEAELAAKLAIYDALLTPASPTPAYRANDKVNDPLAMFSGDKMTVNVNLAGLPAIVVRSGQVASEEGKTLPVGLQIIGRPFEESALLDVAHTLEICTFDTLNPLGAFASEG
jgi:aspartyl-tRNA(Asn)/glutamyl-tRNA(Gln) amidotransferase subunit A